MDEMNVLLPEIKPRDLHSIEGIQNLLKKTTDAGASDVWFVGGFPVTADIHGRKINVTDFKMRTKDNQLNIINKIQDSNGAESRLGGGRVINTTFEFYSGEKTSKDRKLLRFRVNAIASERGFAQTLRTIPNMPPTIEQVGLEQSLVDVVHQSKDGIALVVGSTGSGKSSTLAAINRFNLENNNDGIFLVTFEDPIEYTFKELKLKSTSIYSQQEVFKNIKSYAEGVKNALRMKPDHVMIGEIRDCETLEEAINISNSGHFTLSTLHASDVPTAVTRMLALYPIDAREALLLDLISNLRIIIYQRLLRTKDGKRCACREYLIFDDEVREYLYMNMHRIKQALAEALNKYGVPYRTRENELRKNGILE